MPCRAPRVFTSSVSVSKRLHFTRTSVILGQGRPSARVLTPSSAETLIPYQVTCMEQGVGTSTSLGRETQVAHESAEARCSETSFLKSAVRSLSLQTCPGRPRVCGWTSSWREVGQGLGVGSGRRHLSTVSPEDSSNALPLPGRTHDLARPRPAAGVPELSLNTCFSSIPAPPSAFHLSPRTGWEGAPPGSDTLRSPQALWQRQSSPP